MQARKLIVVAIAALTLFSTLACNASINVRSVSGSGDLERETREVGTFDAISLSGIGTLVIEQGEETELHVEADGNLLRYLESDVRGNTLHLGVEEGTNLLPSRGIRYEVTVTTLEAVTLSGLSNVEIDDLETDRFLLKVSGGGDVEVDALDADALEIRISGVGSVDVEDGKVSTQTIAISGGGGYSARELASQETEIDISGLGRATVRVSETLDVSISGGGSVNYFGDPEVNQQISGVGSVEQLGD
jgi:hypothetical protein